ncbi:MAG: PaaI family thioesterase, partial [bacterium]|nr:PaaI family thioesterase [bacterium]
ADVTGGMAILASYEEVPLTTDFNIAYFKQVKSGKLICRAEVINKGKKMARVDSSIYMDDELIAKASISFSTLKKKHP